MLIYNLTAMKNGWFVGDFEPTCFSTSQFEIAYKRYHAGYRDNRHFHKIATELTLIVGGTAKFNDRICNDGDIIEISPGEHTEFEAVTDVATIVVKVPCVTGDKYLSQE